MRFIITALLSILAGTSAGAFEIPALDGRVVDKAGLLTPAQVASLTARIRSIEEKNGDGAQVVVVTLPSLDGESIDKVKNEILHAWKLGAQGKDNGALLVAAPNERKVGIEVGYGLEGAISDSVAARIIADQMRPHLKRGADNWFAAFDSAVAAIGAAIPDKMAASAERRSSGGIGFFILCVVAMVSGVCALLWFVGRSSRKQREEVERIQRQKNARDFDEMLKDRSAPKYRPTFSGPLHRSGGFVPPRSNRTTAAAAGAAAGAAAASSKRASTEPSRSSRSDDSYLSSSSWGGSSSSSSSSSDSSSYSGGGGDSGGGGSSSDV